MLIAGGHKSSPANDLRFGPARPAKATPPIGGRDRPHPPPIPRDASPPLYPSLSPVHHSRSLRFRKVRPYTIGGEQRKTPPPRRGKG
jgi:hypothetical protein